MPDDIKGAIESVQKAFEEFKATNDDNLKSRDVVFEDKLNKLNKELDKYENLSTDLTKAQAEARAAKERADELQNSVDELELKLNRPGANAQDTESQKAFWKTWANGALNAVIQGEVNLPEDQRNALAEVKKRNAALTVGDNTTGGYLAPVEMVQEIIKGVTEISPVRSLVRVRSTGMKSLVLPKRTGQFAAQRVSESGTRSETDGLRFGQIEIPMPESYALIDISEQNLEDGMFDLEAFIRQEAEEQFALLEGTEVVAGGGVNACEGFMTNGDVGETVSGNATAVTADGLIDLKHAVKTAYTAKSHFVMNRTTLGAVRKLKDDQGQYLWAPGIAAGKPNSIDGDPYMALPDMPNQGAGTFPVAYGDFLRAYTLGDRVMATFLRDPYTQATSGNIRMIFRKRFGGRVVLAEAIRKLKCST